jgi:hypothetical protein
MSVTLRRKFKCTDPGSDVCCHVTALSRFKNLITLNLGKNSIIDGPIKSLTMLRTLVLDDNNYVTDKMLRKLTNVTSLSLKDNNKITSESLRYLTNIKDLCICNNSQINDAALKNLTFITKLDIGCGDLITDESMKHLTQINHLTIVDNELVTDESIMYLTNITFLHVSMYDSLGKISERMKENKNITADNITYKSLKCLTNLTTLYVSGLEIEDHDFRKLTNLRSLELCGSTIRITGASIRFLTGLESLFLTENDFVKNKHIYELTNLTELYAYHCWRLDGDKIRNRIPDLAYMFIH